MKMLRDKRGFTIIEIVVVLAIIGIVMLMATNLIGFSLKSYTNENVQWEIQQDARHAIQYITRDIRSADTIVVNNDTSFTSGTVVPPVLVINSSIRYYQKKKSDGSVDEKLYRFVNGNEGYVIKNLNSISFSDNVIGDYSDKILVVKISTKKPGFDNTFEITTKLYSRLY